MSVLANNYLTLVDLLKQTAKDTVVADIAEIMSQSSDLIKDAHVMECNDGTKHLSVIRHGLPKGVFRKLYGFVPTEKSTTENVTDNTGMLEAYSVIDVDLVEKANNPKQFRLNESKAFIEGMSQTAQETIIYGNMADDNAAFNGLAVRYGAISDKKENIGFNVVDAGGTGNDNTSIWLVTWGEQDTALLYPKGSKGGLDHKDDGIQVETNDKGAKRKVYQDHFKHDLGLTVKDWRSTCRVANISVEKLIAGQVDILALLRKAYFKVKTHIRKSGQKTFIYVNSTIAEALDKAAADKSNVTLNIKEYDGMDIVHYKGIPIRVIDQILETEEQVKRAA